MVTREKDPADRRRFLITVTGPGGRLSDMPPGRTGPSRHWKGFPTPDLRVALATLIDRLGGQRLRAGGGPGLTSRRSHPHPDVESRDPSSSARQPLRAGPTGPAAPCEAQGHGGQQTREFPLVALLKWLTAVRGRPASCCQTLIVNADAGSLTIEAYGEDNMSTTTPGAVPISSDTASRQNRGRGPIPGSRAEPDRAIGDDPVGRAHQAEQGRHDREAPVRPDAGSWPFRLG